MSLSVAVTALIAGIVVWALLVRKLTVKPWEIDSRAQVATGDGAEADVGGFVPKRVGLWIFLAVVTSLFGLFISAYYMRMGQHGQGDADWISIRDPAVLWFNTAVLVLSSVAMQSSRAAATRGQAEQTRARLIAGGMLTLAFLIGQFLAWRQLRLSAAFTPLNPAIAFFYMLTAVHGLHLLGGLYVWARTLRRTLKKEFELIDVRLSIELCTVYWHYLLLVWLGLFAVLLST